MKKNVEKKTVFTGLHRRLSKIEKRIIALVATLSLQIVPVVYADDAGGGAAAGGGGNDGGAFQAISSVVHTVAHWLTVGALLVILLGSVMLGFAIKGNDADGKQNAVTMMVGAGIVAAVCGALSVFGF